mgnify:CR=1 FL=1
METVLIAYGEELKQGGQADTTREAWISKTRSAVSMPAAPEIIMAGVTQPTIMATTC